MTRNIGIPRRPLGPFPRYLPIVFRVALAAIFVLAGLALLFLATVATPAEAQWRGHHRGYHHDRWQHQERRHDGGGSFVGGIIGGVIGGMITNRAPTQPYYDPVAYCVQRYRSYNPETGVYLGYDGIYRRCP